MKGASGRFSATATTCTWVVLDRPISKSVSGEGREKPVKVVAPPAATTSVFRTTGLGPDCMAEESGRGVKPSADGPLLVKSQAIATTLSGFSVVAAGEAILTAGVKVRASRRTGSRPRRVSRAISCGHERRLGKGPDKVDESATGGIEILAKGAMFVTATASIRDGSRRAIGEMTRDGRSFHALAGALLTSICGAAGGLKRVTTPAPDSGTQATLRRAFAKVSGT